MFTQLVERACAYIVPVAGRIPTLDQLCEHLVASGLAVQKAPEMLVIVADLPRTASGKVQRFLLREQVRDELASGGPDPRSKRR